MLAQLPFIDGAMRGTGGRDDVVAWAAGVFFLQAVICGAISGGIAGGRGHSGWGWFLFGFVGSVAGVWAAAGLARKGGARGVRRPVACPACGFENHPAGWKCLKCGGEVVAKVGGSEADVVRQGRG